MHDFIAVFKFTFLDNLRKKPFIVSTIISFIIAILAGLSPILISMINNDKSQSNASDSMPKIYFIKDSNTSDEYLKNIKTTFPNIQFNESKENDLQNLKDELKKSKNGEIILLKSTNSIPRCEIVVASNSFLISTESLSENIKTTYLKLLLKTNNISDKEIDNPIIPTISSIDVSEKSDKDFAAIYTLGTLVSLIMFFAIYMYSYLISMSVASEKTSRVMELLITSTTPKNIIFGKTLSTGLLGFLQLLSTILIGFFTYYFTSPKDQQLLNVKINFSILNFRLFAFMLLYFILGFLLYSFLNAVAGSTVSKAEDVNSAIMPISIISLISFYSSMGANASLSSSYAKILSLIPFTSSYVMPLRVVAGYATILEIVLSIVILISSILIVSYFSVKVYSLAILHYGNRLKIKDLFKLS